MTTPTKLLLLSSLTAVVLTGCKSDEPIEDRAAAPKIEGNRVILAANSPQIAALAVEKAKPCEVSESSFNGRLSWDESVTVKVFTPFAGRVVDIKAEPGQVVDAGTPLASIASAEFNQAQAEARKAVTDEAQAQKTLERVKELYSHGASARKDLETAEADLQRAQAERRRSAGRLAFYGVAIDSDAPAFDLKAPIGGVVVDKNINPGQEVRPDQMLASAPQLFSPLFTITDPRKLWVWVDVDEARLGTIKVGQRLTVRSSALPKEVFPAVIQSVSEFLDPVTHTVRVRAAVDNPQRLLKAEMLVTVAAESPAAGVAEVQEHALFLKGERHYVFLQEEQGKYTRREVTPGEQHHGKVLILDGVRPGEQVVTEGVLLLEQLLLSGEGS